jgi:hypothetical protein
MKSNAMALFMIEKKRFKSFTGKYLVVILGVVVVFVMGIVVVGMLFGLYNCGHLSVMSWVVVIRQSCHGSWSFVSYVIELWFFFSYV